MSDAGPLIVLPRPVSASRRLLAAGLLWEVALGACSVASSGMPGGVAGALALPGLVLLAQGWRGLAGHRIFESVDLRWRPDPLPLGAAVELDLVCRPSASHEIARMAVHLRCHERATLREGDREMVFAKKVFEKSVLLAERLAASPAADLSFKAHLRMPGDRSSTFQSDNHRISWTIVLEVEAGSWPVATCSWPLIVLPVLAP